MLLRYSSITLSLALLSGCSVPNNYDPTQNPFDEPAMKARGPHSAPPLAHPATTIQKPALEPKGVPSAAYEAIALPAAPERSIEINTEESSVSPQAQEMMTEANRIGALGDLAGKAELLNQAGYSGSPKAFYDLARMYLDGSFPNDMPQALKYITLSHDAGYAEATRVLGMLYLRGQGVPADERYGRLLLEHASKSSVRAAREYGLLLLNRHPPHLNNSELGLEYLRDAAGRGDRDSALALADEFAKAGQLDEAQQFTAAASNIEGPVPPTKAPVVAVKERALRGDTGAMYDYAQQVLLRKTLSPDPEFTAYCWLSVAEKLGSKEASFELGFISGVRSISDTKSPGRLDQCISDLHYQVSGHK